MSSIYAQCHSTAQKKDASSAASVLDTSSQSESLQRKANMANNATQHAEALRPNNTGMPDNLKSGIESLSGFSMDDVRVHYNSSKPATVQALAYTQGTDIHVAPGQEKHLPHEAWHVAQQMAGRVSPTTDINGMPVNDNIGLEHEADVMGEKAVHSKDELCAVSENTLFHPKISNVKQFVVQREEDPFSTMEVYETEEEKNERKEKEQRRKDAKEEELKPDKSRKKCEIVEINKNLQNKNKKNAETKNNIIVPPGVKNYWINWPAYATGDLPSMSAAILMGFKHGVKVDIGLNIRGLEDELKKCMTDFFKNANNSNPNFDQDYQTIIQKNEEIKNLEEKSSVKLKEVASYLGCSKVENEYAIKFGMAMATSDPSVNSLIVANPIKFSWLTNVVARGIYQDETGSYREMVPDMQHGLKDFSKIKNAWFKEEKKNAIKAFLDTYQLNKSSLGGKNVEVLWIRTSGEKGGAHYENDTSFNALKRYIEGSNGKIFILAGDEKNGKAQSIAEKYPNIVFNLTVFWENIEWKKIANGNRALQFYVFDVIKDMCGSLKHIGSMSGGLEALALIGHDVEFKAKKGETGVDRVERYSKKRKYNDVRYYRRDFFYRDNVYTNGFEKRTAKYYSLFSNFRFPPNREKDAESYKELIKRRLLNKYGFLLDMPSWRVMTILFKSQSQTQPLDGMQRIACIEMAKFFAKSEKQKKAEESKKGRKYRRKGKYGRKRKYGRKEKYERKKKYERPLKEKKKKESQARNAARKEKAMREFISE